jgi:hypothetical protein
MKLNNMLSIPEGQLSIPGSNITPYVIIDSEGFELSTFLLHP